MFWKIIGYLLAALCAIILIFSFKKWLFHQNLRRQGVVFASKLPFIFDSLALLETKKVKTNGVNFDRLTKARLQAKGYDETPTFTGVCVFGMTIVVINDPMLLEEVYVKRNQYYTKP
jgi:hypothetical protein